MSAHNVSHGMPRLFRTYVDDTGVNQSYDCAIWEAARATCAYPLFFDPIQIGPPGLKEPFVDGGLGCNNPLEVLLQETYSLFPDRRISCIISLGTGQLDPISVHPKKFNDALLEIVRDCEGAADAAALRFRGLPNVYHRFTVSRGMQSIEHDRWDQANTIRSHTNAYLELADVSRKFSAAVKCIGSRDAGKISTKQLSKTSSLMSKAYSHYPSPRSTLRTFRIRRSIDSIYQHSNIELVSSIILSSSFAQHDCSLSRATTYKPKCTEHPFPHASYSRSRVVQ